MPCLVVVGHPSAGKTTVANLLKERALLHDSIDEVVILNEETECGCISNDVNENVGDVTSNAEKKQNVATTKQSLYETSLAEKQTRGALKAAFDRAVKKSGGNNDSSRRLVILDSLNYIKGFRYELHCISKAAGEKHGILWVLNRLSVVQEWNKNYSSVLLQELISRFEPPDDRNRWDKPLFTIDVAAASSLVSSSCEGRDSQVKKNLSSKNEVLERSVYNMHSLGEAFGSSEITEQTYSNTGTSSIVTESQQVSKTALGPSSRQSKAPKKSAFQRRRKVSKTVEKDTKKITPTLNHNNKIVIDTSMMNSSPQDTSNELERIPGDGNPTPSSSSGDPQPTKENQRPTSDNKSFEEQLDEILDVFLLRTRNLKEGMSTRQYE
eukprot:CAMPEP_0172374526 /NCGR_PEP_ID=MMETSP1060-20121228/56073_1 /TAXON_ID=37318 /ORGANISM="Pseudo-nitzschia pungens, Strain cf. cingulata" /LENGTH=380 /DNA_ID=CAMNT_0013101227 /DNA_START=90 /DNA_END=1232 /DNA_ORIENTATION=+